MNANTLQCSECARCGGCMVRPNGLTLCPFFEPQKEMPFFRAVILGLLIGAAALYAIVHL